MNGDLDELMPAVGVLREEKLLDHAGPLTFIEHSDVFLLRSVLEPAMLEDLLDRVPLLRIAV